MVRLCLLVCVAAACAGSPAETPQLSGRDAPSLPTQTLSEDSSARPVAVGEPTVLVELFTSQGCSSCPPADELLSDLDDETIAGATVIPLAFHVDYWNYIGWNDPFSKKAWTKRQRRYARAVSGGRVYTPQLVIGGRTHAVGSRVGDIKSRIRDAAKARRSSVAVAARATLSGSTLRVTLEASGATGEVDVLVAVTESGLATKVKRGENSGRKLRNDHIVRALKRALTLSIDETSGTREIEVSLDSSWKRDNISVVVFAQDGDSLAVLDARRVSIER